VISTAQQGDSIEVGLFVNSTMDSPGLPDANEPSTSTERLKVRFDVAHKYASGPDSSASSSASRSPSPSEAVSNTRPPPQLNSAVLRSLIRHLSAALRTDLQPQLFKTGRAYDLTLVLERGIPSAVDPSVMADAELSSEPGSVKIANEPTLEELMTFAETLKGKKVTLHASSKGSFAHHLSSYLTAWGLDVSHAGEGISDAEEISPISDKAHGQPPIGLGMEGVPAPGTVEGTTPGKSPGSVESSPGALPQMSFVFIDDNVQVLRERLRKLRAEQSHGAGGLQLGRKRPSLASNHRPRSSPRSRTRSGRRP
jgi:osomolarity two-component system response regulator SSK1